MRIAIFSESYEPIINGVSVCVHTLREGLAAGGHEVYVFAPRYKGHNDSRDDVLRFPSVHTVLMPDYPFPVPFSPGIKRKFAEMGFDLVHTQTPFLLGVVGARWARRRRIPLVSTSHTLYTEYAHYVPFRPKEVTRRFLISLMKWYYSGCDAVVAPSEFMARTLRSYGVRTPIEVIKTGVVGIPPLSAERRAAIRRDHGLDENGFLLLYVGRVAREKNLTTLLRAFQTVRSRHDNARLVIVGGGPALEETRRFAEELGLADRLWFAGMRRREQIDPLYSAADAFAFPSSTETQGIAICEALSAGLPVVAVNAGGIPENIREGVDGFLTSNDPDQFAERISLLITDEQRRKEMSANARQAAESFSIERMVRDFERFYTSVVQAQTVPAPAAQTR